MFVVTSVVDHAVQVPARVAAMQAQALAAGPSAGAVPMAPVQSAQWVTSQATPLQGPPQSMPHGAPQAQGQGQVCP